MEINVFDWEQFERWKRWYIWFISFFSIIIFLSLISKNIEWAIIIFFILWWYTIFWLVSLKQIKILLTDEWLLIWKKIFPWSSLNWFAIDLDEKTLFIKNLIILNWNTKLIHTLNDNNDSIKQFILALSERIPLVGELENTFFERLIRKLKL